MDGMFGMVTALVIKAATASTSTVAAAAPAGESPVIAAARAAGSTALTCRIPGVG
jgi:hypothetical protein